MDPASQTNLHRRAETLVNRLIGTGLANPEDLRGCSEADILTLEHAYDVRLPESYKYFLRRLGRGAGGLFESGSCFAIYDAVMEMTGVFQEGFGDRVSVPAQWCCFAVKNNGDTFLFLPADGSSDDPPVFCWSEEWSEGDTLEEGYPSFWDWFEEEVRFAAVDTARSLLTAPSER